MSRKNSKKNVQVEAHEFAQAQMTAEFAENNPRTAARLDVEEGRTDVVSETLAAVAPELPQIEVVAMVAEVPVDQKTWDDAIKLLVDASVLVEKISKTVHAKYGLDRTTHAISILANKVLKVRNAEAKSRAYWDKVGSKKGERAEAEAKKVAKKIAELEALGFKVAKAE